MYIEFLDSSPTQIQIPTTSTMGMWPTVTLLPPPYVCALSKICTTMHASYIKIWVLESLEIPLVVGQMTTVIASVLV